MPAEERTSWSRSFSFGSWFHAESADPFDTRDAFEPVGASTLCG
jgi:hypothetical protein